MTYIEPRHAVHMYVAYHTHIHVCIYILSNQPYNWSGIISIVANHYIEGIMRRAA